MTDWQTAAVPAPMPQERLPHQRSDSVLAVLCLVCAFFLVRWGVWGGARLGFSVAYTLFFALVTAFACRAGMKAPRWHIVLFGLSALGLAWSYAVQGNDHLLQSLTFLFGMGISAWYIAGLYSALRYDDGGLGGLANAVLVLFYYPFARMGKALATLFGGNRERRTPIAAILLGVGAALPFFFFASGLLLQGDAAFSTLLGTVAQQFGLIVGQFVLALLLFFLLFGLLFGLRRGLLLPPVPAAAKTNKGFETLPLTAFLGMMALLYIVYLLAQLGYCFKGFAGTLPEGYSLASYARQGFFELCVVAGLNFVLVMVVDALAKPRQDGKPVRTLLGVQVFICSFTLLILCTAAAKLWLYMQRFGLTLARLQASFFIVFLAVAVVLLLVRQFVRQLPFVCWTAVAACLLLLVMNWCNMDTWVLRYNLHAYESGQLNELDVEAFASLGVAKVPYLIDLSRSSHPEHAKDAMEQLDAFVNARLPSSTQSYVRKLRLGQTDVLQAHNARPWTQGNAATQSAIAAMDAYMNDSTNPLLASYCQYCKGFKPHLKGHERDCLKLWKQLQSLPKGSYCSVCGDETGKHKSKDCPRFADNSDNDSDYDWLYASYKKAEDCQECYIYRAGHRKYCSKYDKALDDIGETVY